MPVPDGDNIFMAECMTRVWGNGTAVQHGGLGSAQGVHKYLRENKLDPLSAWELSLDAFKLIHLRVWYPFYVAGIVTQTG